MPHPKNGGWFSTYVLSDKTRFFVIVHGDADLGVFIYSTYTATLAVHLSGKIAFSTAASTSVDIQPSLYMTDKILVPILDNIYIAASNN